MSQSYLPKKRIHALKERAIPCVCTVAAFCTQDSTRGTSLRRFPQLGLISPLCSNFGLDAVSSVFKTLSTAAFYCIS